MKLGAQELAAIAIALLAALYLVSRLTGYPRRKRKPPPVHLGSALERGIKVAKRRHESRGAPEP
jgi:hypothetical protein